MRLLGLTIIALVLVSGFATEEEDQAGLLQLQQMEQTEFGRTILDTIQLQLQSEGPVEDLIKMLQEIEKNLQLEQQADDNFINNLQTECDENLEKLVAEIKAAKDRVAELQAELDLKIPIRDEKVKQLRDKNEFKKLLEEKIVDLDNRKALRDQEWALAQEEHDKASYVIQKAKEILVGALQQKSFLQISKSSFAQVSEHFATHAAKYQFKQKSWNRIFQVLSEITARAPVQADQGLVGKVISLCDDLLNKIAESREIERKDYQHWVNEYQNTRDGITELLNKTNNQISNLETEIAALNKRIQAAQYEQQEQNERIINKTNQHKDYLKYCEDENVAYSKRRDARDSDKQVVSNAIGLFQKNLRLFRKYMADRMKNVKKAK